MYCSYRNIEKYLKNYINYFIENEYEIYHYNLHFNFGKKLIFSETIKDKKYVIIAKLYKIYDYINIEKLMDTNVIIICLFLGQIKNFKINKYDYIIFDNEYLRKNIGINKIYNIFFKIYYENLSVFKNILKNNDNKFILINTKLNVINKLNEIINYKTNNININNNNEKFIDFIFDYYN